MCHRLQGPSVDEEKRVAPLAVALNSAESAEADPEAGLGPKAVMGEPRPHALVELGFAPGPE